MTNEIITQGGHAAQPAKSGSKAPVIIAVVVAVVVILALLMVFLFKTTPPLASPLEGRWNIDTYIEAGELVENATGYIEFNNDGTGTKSITSPSGVSTLNFNWEKTGGRLLIGGVSGTYTIIDDSISMTYNFWSLSGTKA